MTDPVFLVGACVRFGVASDGYPLYGWPRNVDFEQWEYVSGRVVACDDFHVVKTDYLHPDTGERRTWLWPLEGKEYHHPDQWQLPGFLELEQTQTIFQDLVDCQALEQATIIQQALEATGWNLSKTSNLLGFKQTSYLYGLLRNSLQGTLTRKKKFFRELWEEYQTKKPPRGRPKRPK